MCPVAQMLCFLLKHSPKWAHIVLPFLADNLTLHELNCAMYVYNVQDLSLLRRSVPNRQGSFVDARVKLHTVRQRLVGPSSKTGSSVLACARSRADRALCRPTGIGSLPFGTASVLTKLQGCSGGAGFRGTPSTLPKSFKSRDTRSG